MKKRMLRRLGGRRRGFTLIELLIVLSILAVLAAVVVLSLTGFVGRGGDTAYATERDAIYKAVILYHIEHAHEAAEWERYPVFHSGSWRTTDIDQDGSLEQYEMINLCLLYEEGYFVKFPRSAKEIGPRDNCSSDGSVDCGLCDSDAHYSWFWNNTDQAVNSLCKGGGCECQWLCPGCDGYHGVWP